MKIGVALLLSAGLAAAQKPRPVAARADAGQIAVQQASVIRASIQTVEKKIDVKLFADPTDLMGTTRGLYLPGFGVVLTAEVALVKLGGPSPFHQTFTNEERVRARARKTEALPKFKEMIQAALIAAAGDLGSVPANEKLVFAVNLFYWNWEDRTGFPSQIVLQGTRQELMARPAAIQVQEF
jgi:hypothetical protein